MGDGGALETVLFEWVVVRVLGLRRRGRLVVDRGHMFGEGRGGGKRMEREDWWVRVLGRVEIGVRERGVEIDGELDVNVDDRLIAPPKLKLKLNLTP